LCDVRYGGEDQQEVRAVQGRGLLRQSVSEASLAVPQKALQKRCG